jgi:hypothetical protein
MRDRERTPNVRVRVLSFVLLLLAISVWAGERNSGLRAGESGLLQVTERNSPGDAEARTRVGTVEADPREPLCLRQCGGRC